MAIISCPNCGSTISSTYHECPHCGKILSKEDIQKELDKKAETQRIEQQKISTSEHIKQIHNKKYAPTTHRVYVDDGSYGAGFALGFLLGLIGLIITIAISKSETKRGGVHGFLVQLVLGVIVVIIRFCAIPR